MNGRVAVVTGATSGIGRWVAQGVAAMGATTVVLGRTEARTRAVAEEIAQQVQNPNVHPLAVTDLALRSEVARAAGVLLEQYPHIDLLVNNAGAYYHAREVTAEGIERTFALNVLAPFLLTSLLLPKLVPSAPSRIVNVSSAAHFGRTVDLADLQFAHGYGGYRAYGSSKLELLLLSREFARRLQDQGVTVDAVHPGFVRSGFGRNNPGRVGTGFRVIEFLFARNVRKAAADVVFVATDPSVEKVTGEYFSKRKVHPGSDRSHDLALAGRLFDACALLAKPYV